MVKRLLCLMWAFLIAGPLGANALTLKSGEVLSPDGNVYTGASPEQQERQRKASRTSSRRMW